MAGTMGCQAVRRSQSHQNRSQFGLRAETRPHEVGIASNRISYAAVNTFPSFVLTARQARGAGSSGNATSVVLKKDR